MDVYMYEKVCGSMRTSQLLLRNKRHRQSRR